MKRAVLFTGEWFLLFMLWLLFADSWGAEEVIAGAVAAVGSVLTFEVSRRAEPMQFRPPLGAVLQAWLLPFSILQGTWTLIVELGRRIQGRRRRSAIRLTPFSATGRDGRSAAKRALAILYGSLPPNSLIIGIDGKAKLMLFHQVRKEPVPELIRRVESA